MNYFDSDLSKIREKITESDISFLKFVDSAMILVGTNKDLFKSSYKKIVEILCFSIKDFLDDLITLEELKKKTNNLVILIANAVVANDTKGINQSMEQIEKEIQRVMLADNAHNN